MTVTLPSPNGERKNAPSESLAEQLSQKSNSLSVIGAVIESPRFNFQGPYRLLFPRAPR